MVLRLSPMRQTPLKYDSSVCVAGRRASVYRWGLVVLIFLTLSRLASAQQTTMEKDVLILRGGTNRNPDYVSPLESAIRARTPSDVNFYVEYLETARFDQESYEKSVAEILQRTYSGQKIDLVIPLTYPTLEFVLKHRNELFAGVPIVFAAVDTSWLGGHNLWHGVTGVTVTASMGTTIDLAFHLHPGTDTVAIISGSSKWERHWLAAMHAELLRHQDKVREIDLVSLPARQLLQAVAALPPRTFVLFNEDPEESRQPLMGVYEVLAWVADRLPTYCIVPICLGHGGIGGDSLDLTEQKLVVADLVGRVLSGERPDDIPVVHGARHNIVVDWRQLRRWHIKEASLPPGSVVLYREPSFWERDKKYVLAALALIVVQALLIMGLLWQRARKRKTEAVLRESEQRFRVMADTTPSIIWMCDPHGKITYLNERRSEFTGPDPSAGYGDSWTDYVHPDDLSGVLGSLARALKRRETFSKEYRLRRHDGVFRWMFDVASPRINGDGSFAGFIGSAIDVTDQKLAQEALEKVSGRLIEAQEKERSRIARDLHDDICQRLALLSMALEQANRGHNGSDGSTKQRLEEIRKSCSEIANDVQSLSHELHSSKLDYLGIVAAIRGFCKEFAEQQEVTVDFTDQNVPKHLPRDVSLCLFRVAQEALHNAAKHSGVSRFVVELKALTNEVQLLVTDCGAGFDVDESITNHGLGLVSMQERVHLVHGNLQIKSRLGEGTEVVVILPLPIDVAGTEMDDEPRRPASTEAA